MISGRQSLAWAILLGAAAFALVAACSSSSGDGGVAAPGTPDGTAPTPSGEAGLPSPDGSTPIGDAGSDAAAGVTALVADFAGQKRTLARAQFGTEPGDGGTVLRTESHLGGDPACPDQSSPTPDYTLIVSGVPRGATGRKLTERDGVTGAFFDFKGDLGLAPVIKAITMDVTVTGEDSATPPTWVAFDVLAAFNEGSVTGHLYATYCASLSE